VEDADGCGIGSRLVFSRETDISFRKTTVLLRNIINKKENVVLILTIVMFGERC